MGLQPEGAYMKVTIHIGMGKNGSSAIQDFLRINEELLNKSGVFQTHLLNNIAPLNSIKTYQESIFHLKSNLSKLRKHCISKGYNHFIWSHEAICNDDFNLKRIEDVKEVFRDDDVNIILFVRRQDLWFQSAFYQWGWKHKTYQGKYLISFDQFYEIRKHLGNYRLIIDRWLEIFPKKSFHIIPYEKGQMKGGLINFFKEKVDLPDLNYKMPPHSNKSYNHFVSELIGLYNSNFEDQNFPAQLVKMLDIYLDDKWRKQPFEKQTLLTGKQRDEILQEFKQCNESIAKDFLNRKDGVLFYDKVEDLSEMTAFDKISVEKIVEILVEIMTNQTNKISEFENQLDFIQNAISKIKN